MQATKRTRAAPRRWRVGLKASLAAGVGLCLVGIGGCASLSGGAARLQAQAAPSAPVLAGDPSVPGAAPNVRGPDGSTPLMWAVYRQDVPEVKRLLRAGAKVDV